MISVYGITDKGALRSQNQDACYYHIVNETLACGVVCDGMGGAKAGDIASRIGVEVFQENMEAHFAKEEQEPHALALRKAVEEGNRAIFLLASNDRECSGMGTTLVGVIVDGEQAYLINIGDSRAYSIYEDTITRLTRDHSVVEAMVQKGNLTPEQARVHPQKNLITRALGTSRSAQADQYEISLEPGQWLLLCSDGLINEMPDEEIFRVVSHADTPEEACELLLAIALEREASDNVTIILFRMDEKE